MKNKIEELRSKITELQCQIEDLAKTKMSNFSFEHTIGEWDCNKSPIELCVYNRFDDPALDSCLFCGEPHERK